jgi:tetratricopeptide (TPR) repeat protein
MLGGFAYKQDDYVAALAYYQEALLLYQRKGEQARLGGAYTNIAITLEGLGRLEEADDYYHRAIDVCRTLGDEETLSFALFNVSIRQRQLGHLSEAENSAYEALTIAESCQDRGRVAMILSSLCGIAMDQGHIFDAVHHAQDALEIWGKQPNPVQLAELLLKLSHIATLEREIESAVVLLGGADFLHHSSGSGRDPISASVRKLILDSAAKTNSASTIHRWLKLGQGLSQDQLVLQASDLCHRLSLGGNT